MILCGYGEGRRFDSWTPQARPATTASVGTSPALALSALRLTDGTSAAPGALGLERIAHEPGESREVVAAVVAAPVDEEAGSPGDAAQVRAVDVVGDPRCVPALAQILREALDVQADVRGVALEIRELERVLMRDEQVVHRPESSLVGGRLRGLRRPLGVR